MLAELDIRIAELEGLIDQMQAVGKSMAKVVSDGILMINRNYPSLSFRIYALAT